MKRSNNDLSRKATTELSSKAISPREKRAFRAARNSMVWGMCTMNRRAHKPAKKMKLSNKDVTTKATEELTSKTISPRQKRAFRAATHSTVRLLHDGPTSSPTCEQN